MVVCIYSWKESEVKTYLKVAQRSEESKACILTQLKTMIAKLRGIAAPDGIGVANVDEGPVFDQRLPDKSFWGPCLTFKPMLHGQHTA
jgi:hypothetical protein